MTIDDLRKYRFIRSEIEALEIQLHDKLYNVKSPSTSSISSHGNSVSNPTEVSAFQAIEIEEEINAKMIELRNLVENIETWLDTVDDPRVRSSIRWHYLIGLKWKDTTKKVYGDFYSDNNSRILVERYFGIR